MTPSSSPIATSTTDSNTQFLSSSIFPKPNIFPLYPGASRNGSYQNSATKDIVEIDKFDAIDRVFDFYDQQLSQYGWQTLIPPAPASGGFPKLGGTYLWSSNDPTVQWDVVASVFKWGDLSSYNVACAIGLYKSAKLDRLPVYPGALIEEQIDTGNRQQRAVRIVYRTDQSVTDITKFYRNRLLELGWEGEIADGSQMADFENMGATQERKHLTVAFTTLPNHSTLVTLQAQYQPYKITIMPSITIIPFIRLTPTPGGPGDPILPTPTSGR